MLLSKGIYLENLERFGILYDEDLYFECFVNNYYPRYYVDKFNIDSNVINMRLFKWSWKELCNFINTNNLKLDGYAIDKTIMNSRNLKQLQHNWKCVVPHDISLYRISCKTAS